MLMMMMMEECKKGSFSQIHGMYLCVCVCVCVLFGGPRASSILSTRQQQSILFTSHPATAFYQTWYNASSHSLMSCDSLCYRLHAWNNRDRTKTFVRALGRFFAYTHTHTLKYRQAHFWSHFWYAVSIAIFYIPLYSHVSYDYNCSPFSPDQAGMSCACSLCLSITLSGEFRSYIIFRNSNKTQNILR